METRVTQNLYSLKTVAKSPWRKESYSTLRFVIYYCSCFNSLKTEINCGKKQDGNSMLFHVIITFMLFCHTFIIGINIWCTSCFVKTMCLSYCIESFSVYEPDFFDKIINCSCCFFLLFSFSTFYEADVYSFPCWSCDDMMQLAYRFVKSQLEKKSIATDSYGSCFL